MYNEAIGGNDILRSGSGEDHMWGDAAEFYLGDPQTGSDQFVFEDGNGADTIYDFERGRDKIDLTELDLISHPGVIPFDKLNDKAIEKILASKVASVGFDVLDSNGNGFLDAGDDYVSIAGGGEDTVIDIGAAAGGAAEVDTITTIGVVDLGADDFWV